MIDRVKNLKNSLLAVGAIIASVEYFKIWTTENYDVMHCYTRINPASELVEDNVFRITSNGTTSCDMEAQNKQIKKKLNKLESRHESPVYYCINERPGAEKVIDKVVGYYGDDKLGVEEYCLQSVQVLL